MGDLFVTSVTVMARARRALCWTCAHETITMYHEPYDPSLRDGRAASRPTCYAPGQRLAGAAPQTPLVGALRLRCEVGAARLQGGISEFFV